MAYQPLNQEQIEAVEYSGKHLLVLAGAGTGKTKTIIERARYLIENGTQPEKIAILSFTRKSANEIVNRLKSILSNSLTKSNITGKTFHSFCNEIMLSNPNEFPQHSYTLLDEDDRESAMRLICGKNLIDNNEQRITAKMVLDVYSYAVNVQCSLSESLVHVKYWDEKNSNIKENLKADNQLYSNLIRKYIELKKNRRYIDYDDILDIVAFSLVKSEDIREKVTARYEHILVDEMQDTNPLQYKLLKSFMSKSHLFCVGDDAQSIYSFRGADFKTIHSFTKIIPDSDTIRLTLNYRSNQQILDLSNWLLEKSSLNYSKKLVSYKGSGAIPQIIHIDDDWEEANIITDSINRVFIENGRYSDSMVLSRTSWGLSKVEGLCIEKKIPYIKLGGTKLMQSAHIRDVVSAMRIITNIYDELAWMRYLKIWDRIGDITASKIISDILELKSIHEVIKYLSNSKNKNIIPNISDTLRSILNLSNNPAEAMKNALMLMDGILKKKYAKEWEYRKQDFEILQKVAKSTTSINEFITEYILDPSAEVTLKTGNKTIDDYVTLSTIHSAKGLESNFCHIINVSPNSYPSLKSIHRGKDEIEEERRCLYVAMTRAKENLYIYRNIRSIHTQDNTYEIEINRKYVNKKGFEVIVQEINKISSATYIKYKEIESNVIAEIVDFSFRLLYKPLDYIDSNDLYFLNNVPDNLVKTVISYKENNYPITSNNREAVFPDFNFD